METKIYCTSTLEQSELDYVIELHEMWLISGGEIGVKANLSGLNLYRTNLEEANLEGANLCRTNLEEANLRCANLEGANLKWANLRCANLEEANLEGANLRCANLEGANLRCANLEEANLWSTVGNGKEIKTLLISDVYHINYTKDALQIGCERHNINDWWGFDDRRILKMDGGKALTWWRVHKDYIRHTIEMFPAN